nr:putative sodium-dependent multivitamin transporter [Megalopta genalis]
MSLHIHGVSQVQVQRFLTAKSMKTATYSLIVCAILITVMMSLTSICGVILFVVYEDCDPVTSGKISTFDKIVPYFAVDKMVAYPGTTGLLIAGIFSATLSTISATINSLAVITLEDYLKPLYRKFGLELPSERATLIGKVLALSYGAISIGFAFVCKAMGSGLITLVLALMGLVGGPVIGVFTLGMFTEAANEIGTILGQIFAFIPVFVLSSGASNHVMNLPLHLDGCDNSSMTNYTETTTMSWVQPPEDPELPYLYRISYTLYLPIGTMSTVLVGYTISLIINKFFPKYSREPDPDLLIPFLAKKIKRRKEDVSKTTNSQLFILQYREPNENHDKGS